jgi:formylglycine-generating enzyme required for sulfatase activity
MDELDLGATIRGFVAGQKLFGRYTLIRQLGRGGMGVVWRAHDESLERDVAIKMLPEMVASDPASVRELKRETSRNQQLSHPHILRVYDFAEGAGLCGITMEIAEGGTLTARRLDQPGEHFDVAQIQDWVRQLCEALDYAHQRAKVVHRDLKPANLMLTAENELKITDFGIAASLSESVTRVSKQTSSSGTPVYMSPQQMMGEKPAVTDDVYALGATLYELLTSKPPFYSGNIILQVQNKTARSISIQRAELGFAGDPVPPEWEQTVAACLAKEAKDRPQTAGEVAERLGLVAKGSTQRTRPSFAGAKSGGTRPGHGTAAPHGTVPAVQAADTSGPEAASRKKSPVAIFAGIAVAAFVLGGLAWYFGIYAPGKQSSDQEQVVAARGGLLIRTEPAGAEVSIGGVDPQGSPATFQDLRVGSHEITVRKAGFADVALKVTVAENQVTEVPLVVLKALGGAVALTSNPSGLEFELVSTKLLAGGAQDPVVRTGRTPADVSDLPLGAYQVSFRRPGWPVQTRPVDITSEQRAAVAAEFAPGVMVVESSPPGAEAFIAGKMVGRTPLRLPEVLPGASEVELRLRGHKTATLSGIVEARQELRLSATLEKLRGAEVGQPWTIPDLNLSLQPIAPGTFQMGSVSGGSNDERPVTRVTISRPYWLGKTEVTQGQWQAVMGGNPSHFKGENLPVETVSWNDAMEFCRKLTERERIAGRLPEGYVYTLPTGAEWEYACRAGTTGDYAGNIDEMGWHKGNSTRSTKPVGQLQANAWGLHDMHGNVSEWSADWYGTYPGGSVTDPTGATTDTYRVHRGGSWTNAAGFCRSAYRNRSEPDLRFRYLGFRLALTASR